MPRKKSGLNGWLANIHDDEKFGVGIHQELAPSEKQELRHIFESPVFKKALANSRLSKPPVFGVSYDTALGQLAANNRFHELRGWKMFEAALALQAEPPRTKRAAPQDNFPDEGRIDHKQS
jgi:hypothetical protein